MAESQETSNRDNSKMATGFFNTDAREVHEFSDDINIADIICHSMPCKINGINCINRKKTHSEDRNKLESVEHVDALYMKMEMTSIGKEYVSISVDKGVMTIKTEPEMGDDGDKWCLHTYFRPVRMYKVHDIKAVMKNDLLKVVVPRDENKQDAFMDFLQVQIN